MAVAQSINVGGACDDDGDSDVDSEEEHLMMKMPRARYVPHRHQAHSPSHDVAPLAMILPIEPVVLSRAPSPRSPDEIKAGFEALEKAVAVAAGPVYLTFALRRMG